MKKNVHLYIFWHCLYVWGNLNEVHIKLSTAHFSPICLINKLKSFHNTLKEFVTLTYEVIIAVNFNLFKSISLEQMFKLLHITVIIKYYVVHWPCLCTSHWAPFDVPLPISSIGHSSWNRHLLFIRQKNDNSLTIICITSINKSCWESNL